MIVLDTNVLSELMRPRPAAQVVAWIKRHAPSQLAVTAVTEAEVFYGLEILPLGKRRTQLLNSAEALFMEGLPGLTLPFDSDAARMYSKIASTRRSSGKPISQLDAQIAAIARVHHAILATRNVLDFQGCGVQVVNPWDAE